VSLKARVRPSVQAELDLHTADRLDRATGRRQKGFASDWSAMSQGQKAQAHEHQFSFPLSKIRNILSLFLFLSSSRLLLSLI
jgi:hypothetical protein